MTTIKHHPDVSTLMSCAAGSQPEVFAAVVSSHLSMCPECRREVGRLAEVGVALFDQLKPVSVSSPPPVVRARAAEADVVAAAAAAAPEASGDVPAALTPVLGHKLDELPWKKVAPGVYQHEIRLSPGAKGDLRLLKVAPGQPIPEHGHDGSELTLLLRGSYSDETGTYRTGDVADLDETVEHRPVACPNEGCICLVAVEKPVKYKGVLARLLQPIIGI